MSHKGAETIVPVVSLERRINMLVPKGHLDNCNK